MLTHPYQCGGITTLACKIFHFSWYSQNYVKFVIFLKSLIKMVFRTSLAKIQFSYFGKEIKLVDFWETDITDVKYSGCWYFIWYQCLEQTLISYTLVPK